MLSDNLIFPIQKHGFIISKEKDLFILRSKPDNIPLQLNNTAWLIFCLCDGTLELKEIKKLVKHSYKVEDIDQDIDDTLDALIYSGVIETFAAPFKTPKPILRVGFINFWENFNKRDNWFLWMLCNRFNLILTNPAKEETDIIFCSVFEEIDYAGYNVFEADAIKVSVSLGEETLDLKKYDFVFSDNIKAAKDSDNYFYIPLWTLYFDWINYKNSKKELGVISEDIIFKEYGKYAPETVAEHFYNALFGKDFERLCEENKEAKIDISALTMLENSSNKTSAAPASRQKKVEPILKKRDKKKLAIGMACYDEYDGVYFTVQAIRLYHSEVLEDIEILIIDNNPNGQCADSLISLANSIKELHYIPFDDFTGTASRDIIFKEALSDYVLCVDSHILIAPGAIKKLIDFLYANPKCYDLLQGPLVYDNLTSISTHFKPEWGGGMFGKWETDERGENPQNEPFEIDMQGLGVFACRKDAWLGFNPLFQGFGGEEGYIHEKFRQAGRKILSLPFFRWIHRFNRAAGVPYPNLWNDRIRNYYIGFTELGLDTKPIADHFIKLIGDKTFASIYSAIKQEMENPFFYFDAIYCINLDAAERRWQEMQKRFEKLGIVDRVRRFSAIETPESHHIGCALSHRAIIEKAEKYNFKNVLIFEDDAIFLDNILELLKKSIRVC
ncbi:MAG: glycosyltransferase family 25 protein [Deltaproteobacteria bacterium]|nr:glycosyltransferase family 25 protein [Deltaproteobacteria bacterium]